MESFFQAILPLKAFQHVDCNMITLNMNYLVVNRKELHKQRLITPLQNETNFSVNNKGNGVNHIEPIV